MTESGDYASDRKGPVFDVAMRLAVGADPAAVCELLGIETEGVPVREDSSFPASERRVDLLLRLGPERLAHLEYQRVVEADFVGRLMHYRGLIMLEHPRARLSQHVIVLGEGRVQGHDDLARHGFALDLTVLYLREHDPAEFLTEPALAPFAVLGRGSPDERIEAYESAVDLITSAGGEHLDDLIAAAARLATIHLDRHTIGEITKGVGTVNADDEFMNEIFGDSIWTAARDRKAEAKGRAEGRFEIVSALLTQRFGAHPDVAVVAERLGSWPEAQAVAAVLAAGAIEDIPAEPTVDLRAGANR